MDKERLKLLRWDCFMTLLPVSLLADDKNGRG